jgi:hypothetical protein
MQSKVQNLVANTFAVRFYDMLGNGLPIDWAVKEARDEVGRMKGLTESQKLAFGTPVVYLSSYGGLIDRPAGGGLSVGRGVGSTSPERDLLPTVEVCPCGYRLKEAARLKIYCPNCKLQLRCTGADRNGTKCNQPLDDPRASGCYCGACGSFIASLEAVGNGPRVAPAAAAPDETQLPSLPPTAPSLEQDLRMKFPFKPPPASG